MKKRAPHKVCSLKKRVRNPELQAKQSFHVDIDGVDRAIAVNALQQALTACSSR